MLKRVCGIDEAGRGAWAGPLIAAAVILPCSQQKIARLANTKIKDGKLLQPHQRRKLYFALKKVYAEMAVEVISTRSINNHGMAWANNEIIKRLIKKVEADEYIVDGNLKIRVRGKTNTIHSIINADATIPAVILAGIVAKVERDKLMRKLHRQFPRYKWHHNVGYGTKEHKEAIVQHNWTYYHRTVYVTTALRKLPKNP